ncbi:MAG TPA: hypothetical protein VGP47_08445 [Parachlamydiaceae bacterium]|nr:hypothetical protein [Parachlamydiaceae bacterium]
MNLNTNYITPDLKLYTTISDLNHEPVVKESWAINMISIIKKTTTQAEFEAAWEKNPDYKLEMTCPIGSYIARNGLCNSVYFSNLEMTKFFIKNLDAKNLDVKDNHSITPLVSAVDNIRSMNMFNQPERYPELIIENDQNLEITRELLLAGAKVNLGTGYPRFDGFNSSLLTTALGKYELPLTKLLLQFGAQKFYAFTPDKKALIKQKFTDEENIIYKQAKKELREKEFLFIRGRQNVGSTLHCFPSEIVTHILTLGKSGLSGRGISSNQKRIDEAKKLIEENKKLALINDCENSENKLMLANY